VEGPGISSCKPSTSRYPYHLACCPEDENESTDEDHCSHPKKEAGASRQSWLFCHDEANVRRIHKTLRANVG
jgi:hypothetical protein